MTNAEVIYPLFKKGIDYLSIIDLARLRFSWSIIFEGVIELHVGGTICCYKIARFYISHVIAKVW